MSNKPQAQLLSNRVTPLNRVVSHDENGYHAVTVVAIKEAVVNDRVMVMVSSDNEVGQWPRACGGGR
jgi:hypothetical protein